MSSLYDFEATTIDGSRRRLADLQGQVVLIVNTASECGFTPQFAGLEALWQRYKDQGLAVVGFPTNQFGQQDPGSNAEIADFCQRNYGVSFPMMEKIEVNGAGAHPLWRWLKEQAPGLLGSEGIKWNFTKFLVGRDGRVIKRYAPTDKPESLAQDIEKALAAPAA
jgi:glutathione peroxidase